jgi:cyclophilin family peptidyl-prolyl cis-trans isomerase
MKGYEMSQDLENTLYLELENGRIVIMLRDDLAPKHVARIKELAREGYYDGLTFHRVIPDFMAQAGCPDGDGTGGSGQKIEAEFSDEPYIRGTVGMARTMNPDSGDSQFFITFGPTPHLNGQYTVWGQVTEGMDLVDEINVGEPPAEPSVIKAIKVAADVKDAA